MSDQANVVHVNFTPGKHGSGPAKCMGCQHTWEAVVPVGTTQLDCPACGAWKGILLAPYRTELVWTCVCGCDLFCLTPDGAMCPNCGLSPDDWFGGAA